MLSAFMSVLMLLAAGQLGVHARKFVIANSCKGDVWAAYTATAPQAIKVGGKSGVAMWHQASGQEDVLDVPETFLEGKFWAATGCNSAGTGCKVGGCPSGKCDGIEVGQSGATLAEFSLGSGETYDISITDGFNVPIAITPTGGVGDQCQKVTCGAETDLSTQCDPALAFPSGSDTVWSCLNPCTAGIQFESNAKFPFLAGTAPSCCPANDKSCDAKTELPFYAPLKAACRDGFVFPPETEANHMCKGPSYRIEFCPGGKGIGANPSGNAPVDQCAGGAIVGGGLSGTNSNGGGNFKALAANAGQTCDGSSGSSAGSGTGTDTTGSGTGDQAGGAYTKVQAPAASTSRVASAGTGTGIGTGAEEEAPAPAPAPTKAKTTVAAAGGTKAVSTPVPAAPAPAATSAAAGTCKGRHCRAGGGWGGRNGKRRADERDSGCGQ